MAEEQKQDASDTLACANCGRPPHDDQDWLWWRARPGGVGELDLLCGDCDEGELGRGATR